MKGVRAGLFIALFAALLAGAGGPASAAPGEPDTTVTSPAAGAVVLGPVAFSGTTTDDVGVDRVRIAIRDRDAGQWVRGDMTLGSFFLHEALVAEPGASSSAWHWDITLPPGSYGASIRSVDASGQVETSRPWVTFSVEGVSVNTEPDTSVAEPSPNAELLSPVGFAGSAMDDSGVDRVRVAIRDRVAGLWLQPDGSFATQFRLHDATLDAPGATSTGWAFEVELPAGSYFVTIRAIDDEGLVETSRPRFRFSVAEPPDPDPVSFRAIADLPYSPAELVEMQQQLPLIDPAAEEFVVHLGDIKSSADTACGEQYYIDTRDALLLSPVPSHIIPGDNEWNDCADLDQAWSRWVQHFDNFEDNYTGEPAVLRQAVRNENFAFVIDQVVFIGINNVGNQQPGQADWDQIDADNAAWVAEILNGVGADATSAVVFGHALPKESLLPPIAAFAKPVLYLMGDLHVYAVTIPYPLVAPNMTQVIQDRGMPGLGVTATHDPADPWILNLNP